MPTDEEEALLQSSEKSEYVARRKPTYACSGEAATLAKLLVSIILIALGITAVALPRSSTAGPELASLPASSLTSLSPQLITARNKYGASVTGSAYPWLSGKIVVEPHTVTNLSVENILQGKRPSIWTIATPDNSEHTVLGNNVDFNFNTLGLHQIQVTVFDEDGMGKDITTEAYCLYVKREIRTLQEEDRDNFLDAMFSMWSHSTSEGRAKYGPEFIGMDSFVSVHADQSTGDIKCDHWHEGTGFLSHHLALSTSFEMSLRAIDKRVTTPYWDFTMEGESLLKDGLGPKRISSLSPIFTDAWFGSTDDMSHVVDSRWAHVPSIRSAMGDHVHNSYGIVRAPWNNANDKELVRHLSDVCGLEPVNKPVPTCATHVAVLNETSLSKFLMNIAGYGHGPMHVNIGGVFGACTGAMAKFYREHDENMKQVMTMTEISDKINSTQGWNPGWKSDAPFNMRMMIEKYMHLEYFHVYRSLWRSQMCALDGQEAALTCPESCSDDTPDSECVCTCKGIDGGENKDFDWENIEPCLYSSENSESIFKTMVPTQLRKDCSSQPSIPAQFCSTGVKEGEMLESASPGDPLFWMIHPVLDRLLTAKRLAKTSKITFGNMGVISPLSDESWLDYSYYHTSERACAGHGVYDAVLDDLPLPSSLVAFGDMNGDGALSNVEFYDVTDPQRSDTATYIFDNFDWNHCDKWDRLSEFSTGYGEDQEKESSMFTFAGGVNPTKWNGELFGNIRPYSLSVSDYKEMTKKGLAPGEQLKKSNQVNFNKAYSNEMFTLDEESSDVSRI